MNHNVLLMDIGHTNIKFATVDHKSKKIKNISEFSVMTSPKDLVKLVYANLGNTKYILYVCNTVQDWIEKLNEFIKLLSPIKTKIIDLGSVKGILKFPINSETGTDILSAAVFAVTNSKKRSQIILNLGTAGVAVAIKNRKIMGVVIGPGLQLQLTSMQTNIGLDENTPYRIEKMRRIAFPKSTKAALMSGALTVTALGYKNLIASWSVSLEKNSSLVDVYLSGGGMKYVDNYFPVNWENVKRIVLEGLNIFYLNDQKH